MKKCRLTKKSREAWIKAAEEALKQKLYGDQAKCHFCLEAAKRASVDVGGRDVSYKNIEKMCDKCVVKSFLRSTENREFVVDIYYCSDYFVWRGYDDENWVDNKEAIRTHIGYLIKWLEGKCLSL